MKTEFLEHDYSCYDDDDNEIDCDDMFDGMVLAFAFMENMTAYEDGDMNATEAYMTGSLKVEGSMSAAMELSSLLA